MIRWTYNTSFALEVGEIQTLAFTEGYDANNNRTDFYRMVKTVDGVVHRFNPHKGDLVKYVVLKSM